MAYNRINNDYFSLEALFAQDTLPKCCFRDPIIMCDHCGLQLCPGHSCQVVEKGMENRTGVQHRTNFVLCEVCARKLISYGVDSVKFMLLEKGR